MLCDACSPSRSSIFTVNNPMGDDETYVAHNFFVLHSSTYRKHHSCCVVFKLHLKYSWPTQIFQSSCAVFLQINLCLRNGRGEEIWKYIPNPLSQRNGNFSYLTQNDPILTFTMNMKSEFSQFSNTTIDRTLSKTKRIETTDNQKSISGRIILLPYQALFIQLIW